MINRAVLIVSFIIITYGLYRLDKFLIPTLDYFGKFVYFGALNIFIYIFVYKIQQFFNQKNQIIGNTLALAISIGFMAATLKI
jgi:putative flippase GtrA